MDDFKINNPLGVQSNVQSISAVCYSFSLLENTSNHYKLTNRSTTPEKQMFLIEFIQST